jgi:hypothetical protein
LEKEVMAKYLYFQKVYLVSRNNEKYAMKVIPKPE